MAKFSLRGDSNRLKFVQSHSITCIGHLELLAGQSQECCCGRKDITSEYMVFLAKKTEDPQIEGQEFTFIAGPACGHKIAQIANIGIPPLVSIFKIDSLHTHMAVSDNKKSPSTVKFSPMNKEIFTAISIMFTIWGEYRNKSLIKVFDFIQKRPDASVFPNYICSLNEAVMRTAQNRKLECSIYALVDFYATQSHKTPRQFNFPHIREFIQKETSQSINCF